MLYAFKELQQCFMLQAGLCSIPKSRGEEVLVTGKSHFSLDCSRDESYSYQVPLQKAHQMPPLVLFTFSDNFLLTTFKDAPYGLKRRQKINNC